jgi:hypothetical protein
VNGSRRARRGGGRVEVVGVVRHPAPGRLEASVRWEVFPPESKFASGVGVFHVGLGLMSALHQGPDEYRAGIGTKRGSHLAISQVGHTK